MPTQPPVNESSADARASGSDEIGAGVLARRRLLRGSAAIAGAAAGGAAAAVLAQPGAAHAADGDALLAGSENSSTSTTGLKIGGGSGSHLPALSLGNENGPSLHLQPLHADFAGFMDLGQVTNTVLGPVIGVDTILGHATTYLVTGVDLADVPTQVAMPTPARLLDTRKAAGRDRIVASSSSAFTSAGRLKAKAWLDIEVAPVAGDYLLPSVYLNVEAVSPRATGQLKVYRPGQSAPAMATVRYAKKIPAAGLAFVATGIVQGRYVVRIYATAETHIVGYLTGYTVKGDVPVPEGAGNRTNAERSALTSRLRSTLADRAGDALGR